MPKNPKRDENRDLVSFAIQILCICCLSDVNMTAVKYHGGRNYTPTTHTTQRPTLLTSSQYPPKVRPAGVRCRPSDAPLTARGLPQRRKRRCQNSYNMSIVLE